MSSLESIPRGRDQLVTASALVRQFGVWQDRAQRAPVYILHRGRPRLVLTSLDLMNALCAPHEEDGAPITQQLCAVLDGAREAIVLADDAARVVATGRLARSAFGVVDGDHATAFAPGDPFLAAAIDRVLTTHRPEAAEFVRDDRRWVGAIEPYPGGIAIFVSDATDALAQRSLEAGAEALAAAALADGGVAVARIGLRGYIEAPDAAFSALTGVAADALATARFVALMSVDSRVAVGEAIETAIAGQPLALDATLLVNRGAPQAVRVALAPIRGGRAVEAVSAIVRVTQA